MVQVRAALEKSEAEEDAKARVAVGVKALMEAAESSASWRALLRSPRHCAESLFRQVAEKRELQPLDLFGPPADGGVLQRLFSRRGVRLLLPRRCTADGGPAAVRLPVAHSDCRPPRRLPL